MVEAARFELASTCFQNRDFALSYASIKMVLSLGLEPRNRGAKPLVLPITLYPINLLLLF